MSGPNHHHNLNRQVQAVENYRNANANTYILTALNQTWSLMCFVEQLKKNRLVFLSVCPVTVKFQQIQTNTV